jgi:hypothetical protein
MLLCDDPRSDCERAAERVLALEGEEVARLIRSVAANEVESMRKLEDFELKNFEDDLPWW